MTNTYHLPNPVRMGWLGRTVSSLITLVLFIGGFFASLMMLAIGGAILLATILKVWLASKTWTQTSYPARTKPSQGQVLDGEYQVKSD